MAKWNKKHCRRIQQSAVLHLSNITPPKKLYDFKRTKHKGKYTVDVPSWKEYYFLEHLKKCCILKVIKRRVTKEPLNSEFLDEIHFTVVVYK